jgi:hypothetical protein
MKTYLYTTINLTGMERKLFWKSGMRQEEADSQIILNGSHEGLQSSTKIRMVEYK